MNRDTNIRVLHFEEKKDKNEIDRYIQATIMRINIIVKHSRKKDQHAQGEDCSDS